MNAFEPVGAGSRRNVESDEQRNMAYEGSTASGARSGATGATGAGVTEGVRGLNLTDNSGVSCNNTALFVTYSAAGYCYSNF